MYISNDFLKSLGNNLGGVLNFFLKYFMQIAFVSNMISLLDIGHSLKIIRSRIRFNIQKVPFKDDEQFSVGASQA